MPASIARSSAPTSPPSARIADSTSARVGTESAEAASKAPRSATGTFAIRSLTRTPRFSGRGIGSCATACSAVSRPRAISRAKKGLPSVASHTRRVAGKESARPERSSTLCNPLREIGPTANSVRRSAGRETSSPSGVDAASVPVRSVSSAPIGSSRSRLNANPRTPRDDPSIHWTSSIARRTGAFEDRYRTTLRNAADTARGSTGGPASSVRRSATSRALRCGLGT